MSLIGLMCKRGDAFSLQVLIGRGLFLFFHVVLSLCIMLCSFSLAGVYGVEVTPVPFPNTVVKLFCDDDTWLVTTREISSMPASSFASLFLREVFGFLILKPPCEFMSLLMKRVDCFGGFTKNRSYIDI